MLRTALASIVVSLACAGCSKPDPNVDQDAPEKAVPDDFAPATAEMIAAADGPPSCDDASITKLVRESLIESIAKPTAEMELRAAGVGASGWPEGFDKAFQDRIHLAVAKYKVSGAAPAGFNAATKAQNCTARVVFSQAGLDGIETINAAYTIELAAPGGPYQARSSFSGYSGLAGSNQARWHMAVTLKAMFEKELAEAEARQSASTATQDQAAPEPQAAASDSMDVSSPPSRP